MNRIILFVHILGAATMGFYLLLPVLLAKVSTLTGEAQVTFSQGIRKVNLIGNIVLVIQLLTGGYLMSQVSYSIGWMIIVLILFIAIGAFSGIVGSKLKKAALDDNGKAGIPGSAITLAWINAAVFFIMILFMVFPITK